jgi:hypothetical protein
MNGDEGGGWGSRARAKNVTVSRRARASGRTVPGGRRTCALFQSAERGRRAPTAPRRVLQPASRARTATSKSAGPENQRPMRWPCPRVAQRGPAWAAPRGDGRGPALPARAPHGRRGCEPRACARAATLGPKRGGESAGAARSRTHNRAGGMGPPPSRSARTHLGRAPADEATDADIVVVRGRWGRDGAALHGAAQWGEKGGREE